MTEQTRVSRSEAEDFLFREARLLDCGDLEEWLALFTADARYYLPICEAEDILEPALIDDDYARLGERVYRLTSTQAHAQMPASQTLHSVTNVHIEDRGDPDVLVRCNIVVYELRVGGPEQIGLGQQRILPGRGEYVLTSTPDGQLRIRRKTVVLLERNIPLPNIAFIV